MKIRDKTIDNLRGLAMLWVIVVHVLYWGHFFENGHINLIKSFCLFEMPLFFFVTGASNSFNKEEGYFNFVFRRYKRLLLPYWVFAVICAALSIVYFKLSDGIDVLTAIKVLISWLIPVDRQITSISYLTGALWFVPVYLCIVLFIPFLKRIKQSRCAKLFVFVLFSIFLITCIFDLGWIQNVAFYSLWTYIGLFWNDITLKLNQCSFRKLLGLIALAGIVVLFLLFIWGYPIDMQYNKFPPNITFSVFSAIVMALILLAVPLINKLFDYMGEHKVINKMVSLYSTRSITIFLYQVFAFNLTIRLAYVLIPGNGIAVSVVRSILCLITTVPIGAVLALIFGRVEQLGTKRKKV